MVVIKRYERLDPAFDSNRNMEQVHASARDFHPKLSTEFASGADRILPIKLNVRPISKPDFLFEHPNMDLRFFTIQRSDSLGLSKRIKNFHSMPRRPNELRFRISVESRNRSSMIRIAA